MSLDTATELATNREVIDQIRAHHTELAAELHRRTWAVVAAAELGDCTAARDALYEWYRYELTPHIVAEEHTLYSAAEEIDAIRLLVCGMFAEHRTLNSLVADLALAHEPFETALIAASAQVLFTSHLGKENDLLLPALDAAGTDLGALLNGMHEVLGKTTTSAGDGCGCGCSCGNDVAAEETPGELDVRSLPHDRRHATVFACLEALSAGAELVVVNDHDPRPLRYHVESLWPGQFEWSYRDEGPDAWRVAVTRVR